MFYNITVTCPHCMVYSDLHLNLDVLVFPMLALGDAASLVHIFIKILGKLLSSCNMNARHQ